MDADAAQARRYRLGNREQMERNLGPGLTSANMIT